MINNAAGSSPASVEQAIIGNLEGLGLPPVDAAAFAGNFQWESHFDTAASNPYEGAIGLAQWEGGRRTALDSYASAHGLQETDLAAQLGYLDQELSGAYNSVLTALQGVTDPGQAAAIVDQQFEGSDGSARATRMANATSIYEQLQNGGLVPDTSSASPGGANTLTAGGVIGKALGVSGVSNDIKTLVLKGLFIAGGVGLVVLGASRASGGARQQLAQLAPIAAAA